MSSAIEEYYIQLGDKSDNPWESVECRTVDPELWWQVDNLRGTMTEEIRESTKFAITICNRCPLQMECLAEGMKSENIMWGIWGGTMAGERLAMAGQLTLRNDHRALTKARNIRRAIGIPLTIGGTK